MTNEKILIIDDDADYRTSARALLEGERYEVLEASSGKEGRAARREQRPDLIVLDVMMESLDTGYSINQAIKFVPEFRDLGPIPIIMVSSIVSTPHASMFPTDEYVPMDAWITKPVQPDDLLQKISKLLSR